MTQSAASGERQALRGYRWQYDHIATLVYDALYDGDFVSLRLTDPEAGRVDDLVLSRRGRTDAYQFKSAEHDGYVTFNQIARGQRTRSGGSAPSLVQSLADGWNSLRSQTGNVHVHLVMQQLASPNDHLGIRGDADCPPRDHFASFIRQVLEPIRLGNLTVDEVATGWRPALTKLREASRVVPEEFGLFLGSLHLDLNAGPGVPATPSTRRSDILALSAALIRRVSESFEVVELDERGVLQLMGWTERTRLHSRHEFPVDLDTYAPLAEAIDQLNDIVAKHDSGYVAVLGPPGAGKSTLLSQALTSGTDRVVRYYAYIPKTAAGRTRLTARGFLHDLVLMLHRSGLDTSERQITSNDIDGLRRQLFEQLDSGSAEFADTRRRTIVVVDGLDHVERDFAGNDSLLGELPRSEELPIGVLFVLGSRTLTPLRAHARQQLEERQAIVDLQHHVLSPASVLEICQRAPVTADLAPELHLRIAELSKGYPLALGYILNRLRDTDLGSADETLSDTPAYQGDIAAEYRAVWNEVQDDADIVEILTACSRLRIGFTTDWLFDWAPRVAVQKFQRKLLYLFRHHHDGWRFFHDSFRQFASDRTALGDDGRPDANADARAHGFVAALCSRTGDRRIAAEQLYHQHFARQEDEVLGLAKQEMFREQHVQLRSHELIREDIGLALGIAAERADVQVMIRLLLALVELDARSSALETVDMPDLLYEAGLAHEAIAYCGYDATRVPLAQAFRLAARLGEDNDPAGLRIFRSIEHQWPNYSRGNRVVGHEHDAAVAWTRAAALFLPLSRVIAAIRNSADIPLAIDRRNRNVQVERWGSYVQTMNSLIDVLARRGDEDALITVESALADDGTQLASALTQAHADGDKWGANELNKIIAAVVDLRTCSRAAIIGLTTTVVVERHLDSLLSTVSDLPVQASTVLDIAEILARHGRADQAREMLSRCPYNKALTVSEISSYNESPALGLRFRYWRLRCDLASNDDETPESVPPSSKTPAGDDIAPDAPVHSDVDAIHLVARIDEAIRKLGQFDAAVAAGSSQSAADMRIYLVRLLDLFDLSTNRGSVSLSAIRRQKPVLMRIIVAVARRYGNGIPEQLKDEFAHRFEMESQQWPTELKLDLAEELLLAGIDAPWYRKALVELKSEAADVDVNSRLEVMADLVRRHARSGDLKAAKHIASGMTSTAFGVGYRKDYQFDHWVSWLGRGLVQLDGDRFVDDAAWLARLLSAVEPSTEGAPRSAAASLPAAVVPADPMAGVRIFEYLVRQGTVQHFDALAALVCALVERAGTRDEATIELAADISADLLAPAAHKSFPALASAIVSAATRTSDGPFASDLAKSMATRTDFYALPTARAGWREGLGLGIKAKGAADDDLARSDVEDIFALVLSSGRRIGRGDVASRIHTVDDIISLRRIEAEDSNFNWVPVIEQQELVREDIPKLVEVFGRASETDPDVLVLLAEAAELNGDQEAAFRIATDAFGRADDQTWARYFGGARLRAASLIVRLGDQNDLKSVCQDLARCAIETSWLPGQLLPNLEDIATALQPGVTASSIWPEIRGYLDGMAETLALTEDEPLADHGCRWWLSAPSGEGQVLGDKSTHGAALAELTVRHLSHASWIVRERASTVVVHALIAGNVEIAEALARFAQSGASDDILERAGRCLAAARTHDGFVSPLCLEQLGRMLATHPSQIMRDLSDFQAPTVARQLSPKYRIVLPVDEAPRVGSSGAFPGPYEMIYETLGRELDLDTSAMLRVAAQYATEALEFLPGEDAVHEALRRSDVRHVYPLEELAASRAAVGRVLADVVDARLLDRASSSVRRLLRTVDIELVGRSPHPRPSVIPLPPPAGVDKAIEWWLSGVEDRLSEYIAAAAGKDQVLIGASSRLTLLNWDHLEEHYKCGTGLGTAKAAEDRVFMLRSSLQLQDLVYPATGGRVGCSEPLVVKNYAFTFHQFDASWLSFRPDLAAILRWKPDPTRPGNWHTSAGDLAVQTIWWVDGWWGHTGRSFDDTEAQGYAVVLTSSGLRDVSAAFGEMTCHFTLTRSGRDDGVAAAPVSATRSLPIKG